MTEILVTSLGSDMYRVEVKERGSSSVHDVRVTAGDLALLAGESDPVTLLDESFRFLLEREPKEAILPRFDLPVVARYFPNYPAEIRKRLAAR